MANYFFPYAISKKVAFHNQITPQWQVTEQSSASGKYRALVTQVMPKYTFSYTCNCLTDDEYGTLLGFFNKMKGGLMPFFFSDPTQNSVYDELLLRTDSGKYALYAPLGDYVEQIFYAEVSKVTVNGVPVTEFSCTDGMLTVPSASETSEVRATYKYYWRVHFTDNITCTNLFYNANRVTFRLTIAR